MLKFILKVWPAFLPIIIYIIWVLVRKKLRKKDYIDGEFKIVGEKSAKAAESIGAFSLRNSTFVAILFSTLILIILALIFIVVTTKPIKQVSPETATPKIIVE